MKRLLCTVTLLAAIMTPVCAQTGTQTAPPVPYKVMNALKAKFPEAAIQKCTKEKEHGAVVYDIEFIQNGQKREVDVNDDGTIENWEQAAAIKDLPAAVLASVEKAYPGCTITEAMQTMLVKDGKDQPEGFEVTVTKADKKRAEITVAPDGKVLEGPGAGK
jgi:uncharacterized membrane protein YkoI